MFPCFINSSNSMFVLILQLPLSSLVGPKIFLSIFLSNTESLCIILSLHKLPVCYRMQNTVLVLKNTDACDEINLILFYLMTLLVNWMMRWLMNNERCGRKPMWSNVRYHLRFFLEEIRKIMEDLEITDLWADFWTWMSLRYEVTMPCTWLQNSKYLCPSVSPS